MKTLNKFAIFCRIAPAALLVALLFGTTSAGARDSTEPLPRDSTQSRQDTALSQTPVRLFINASGRMEVSNETLDQRVLALGRQDTSWFYHGETDRVWQLLSPELKQLLGSAEGLKKFREKVIQQAGQENRVLAEHAQPAGSGTVVYERIASFSVSPALWILQWGVESDGTVTLFAVQPAPQRALSRITLTNTLPR